MRHVAFGLMAVVCSYAVAASIHSSATGQGSESGSPTASKEEIAALDQWVKSATQTHLRIFALYKVGTIGGEAEAEALARYQMHIAKARLAHAEDRPTECAEEYQQAVRAAEKNVAATTAAYEADTVTLLRLAFAHQQLAEAKIALSRLRAASAD